MKRPLSAFQHDLSSYSPIENAPSKGFREQRGNGERRYWPAFPYRLIPGFLLSLFGVSVFSLTSSCGYHMVGSRPLPFQSVTIEQVKNLTYEPKLEEKLHNALSSEFLSQGIRVMAVDGEVDISATITTYQLATIAHIDERVQEQAIHVKVDVNITDGNRTMQFRDMQSPLKITFKTTGTVSESLVAEERATDKAFREIAREIISKMIIGYAQ